MGTHRSRHNKGRKPLYKEHRFDLLGDDDAALRAHETADDGPLSTEILEAIKNRIAEGWSNREICEEFSLESKTVRRLTFDLGYDNPIHRKARGKRWSVRTKNMWADGAFRARMSEKQRLKWDRLHDDLGVSSNGTPLVAPTGSVQDILSREGPRDYSGRRIYFWTGEDLADLRVVANAAAPVNKVAEIFGRTPRAIADKAYSQGIIIPKEWRALLYSPSQREKRVVLAYPYVKKATPDAGDLLRANDLVPKGMPEWMRADICQSVMLALYEGTVTLDEIEANKTKLRWFIKKFHKEQTPWQEVAGYSAGADDERAYHDVAGDWKEWEQNETRLGWDALWHDGGRAMRGTQEEDTHAMLLAERLEAWGQTDLTISEEDVVSIYDRSGDEHDDNFAETMRRLKAMVSRPALFKQQDGRCAYCKCEMTLRWGFPNTITRDHIVARVKGGTDDASNLVGACMECNKKKGEMPVQEFLAMLGRRVQKAAHVP